MSIKDVVKSHCPKLLLPVLRASYHIAAWPARKIILHRTLSYMPYYQDKLSREILHDRIEYLKTGDPNIYFDRAEKEGWKMSGIHVPLGVEFRGIVLVYRAQDKYQRYVKRLLTKIYGDDSFRMMTLKEFLEGGKVTKDELLIFTIGGQDVAELFRTINSYITAHGMKNPVKFGAEAVRTDAQYFDVFSPVDSEIIVDAGAYDGDTALRFLDWGNGKVRHIYSFELDPTNARKCEENLKPYSDIVTLVEKGTWDKDETIRINPLGTGNSGVCHKGDIEVQLTTIDSVVRDEPVTFIKMDVEGAELKSLMGARNTIVKNHPRLAICVYHRESDLCDIPKYILSLVPEYKFYLRHYSSREYETVLYAYCD